MLQRCSRIVFRSFRRLERWADRLTGHVGPVFVALAVVLIGSCAVTFFDVVFAARFLAPGTWWTTTVLGSCWCTYIVYAFSFHYWMAIRTPPGTPLTHLPARAAPTTRVCTKCAPWPGGQRALKPERAHHCRVCRTCVLKYDHHCPWINQCVGHGNERYFVLFLCYFSVACLCVALWGWRPALEALNAHLGGGGGRRRRGNVEWPHLTPRWMTVMLVVLAGVMGLAVGVMALAQLALVSKGETTVESHDNGHYRRADPAFRHAYDFGTRRANVARFFEVDRLDWPRAWLAVLKPVPVRPRSDGWTWDKAPGHTVLDPADELTDPEDDDDDDDA